MNEVHLEVIHVSELGPIELKRRRGYERFHAETVMQDLERQVSSHV